MSLNFIYANNVFFSIYPQLQKLSFLLVFSALVQLNGNVFLLNGKSICISRWKCIWGRMVKKDIVEDFDGRI